MLHHQTITNMDEAIGSRVDDIVTAWQKQKDVLISRNRGAATAESGALYLCDICGERSFPRKASLTLHRRACKVKQKRAQSLPLSKSLPLESESVNTPVVNANTQTCSPVQATKTASPPNFQQLYIDSLLRHIKSLEETVASQRVQLTQLFDLVPKQPVLPAVSIESARTVTTNTHPTHTETPSVKNSSPPNPANKQSKPSNTHPSSSTAKSPPAPPSSSSIARKNVIIIGDSMLKGVDSYKTSRKTFRVTTQVLSGGTVGEINGLARAVATRNPHAMILHVGTNDLYPKSGSDTQDSTRSPRTEKEVADDINMMVNKLKQDFPGTKFIISKLITREDKGSEGITKVKNVNSLLAKSKHSMIENTNIMASHLNGSKLHLKQSGNIQLAVNFANYLNTIC